MKKDLDLISFTSSQQWWGDHFRAFSTRFNVLVFFFFQGNLIAVESTEQLNRKS